MELNEFRPPNNSNDLCLLFSSVCLFFYDGYQQIKLRSINEHNNDIAESK